MPELPEVTTTVKGLNEVLPRLTITNVWTDYFLRTRNKRNDNIKNKKFFEKLEKEIVGEKVKNAERRGKNILIHLSGGPSTRAKHGTGRGKTILIHMKMTGHLLYGKYNWNGKVWRSSEKLLSDPFNSFIHLIFTLSNGRHLAFSDMRKFAKVTLFETSKRDTIADLSMLGPEPLLGMSVETLRSQLLKKPNGKIKTTLMDQTVVAGIGNIYSDEILWQVGVHPERKTSTLSPSEIKSIWKAMKNILSKGIKMGGDSMSDYRNIYGEKGQFQNSHKAYKRAKQKCLKTGCSGTIQRKVVGGRSAHFCNIHQK